MGSDLQQVLDWPEVVMPAATDTLRDVPLFRDLPPAQRQSLSRQLMPRRYRRGQVLFSQGDAGDGLYIVVSGHVGISRQGVDGTELILAVCETGEFFGELALLDDEVRSATASALDAVETQFLSRGMFRKFVEQDPSVLFACLHAVTRELRRCTELVDEIALLDIRRRLARRLLYLADRGMISAGTEQSAGAEPRLTQQQLADMLGATRESVNKHLNALIAEGIVALEHGHVVIVDRERLELAGEVTP